MKMTVGLWLCAVTLVVAAWGASANEARHFMVLAGSKGVFYNQGGPSFVMLMKTEAAASEVEMGAVGIYADENKRPVFGAVPWQAYDPFLRDPARKSGKVMLRLEISEAQYVRVLGILRDWQKRAREDELLYPNDIYMNNILLVKQATEALGPTIDLYTLDWGVNDDISENNQRSLVPLLVFEELQRRNAPLHVPDSKMPEGLLLVAGSEPLAAAQETPQVVQPPQSEHVHHHHH